MPQVEGSGTVAAYFGGKMLMGKSCLLLLFFRFSSCLLLFFFALFFSLRFKVVRIFFHGRTMLSPF